MVKDVDLLSYWIPDLRKIKEFKELAKAEEPELKILLESIDRALLNQFIPTADERGIAHFEKMMGIYPDSDDLEVRRFNALIKFSDYAPYTKSVLEEKLNAIWGDNTYEIIEDLVNFRIIFNTELGDEEKFNIAVESLHRMLPCNLLIVINSTITANTEMEYKVACVPSIIEKVYIEECTGGV